MVVHPRGGQFQNLILELGVLKAIGRGLAGINVVVPAAAGTCRQTSG